MTDIVVKGAKMVCYTVGAYCIATIGPEIIKSIQSYANNKITTSIKINRKTSIKAHSVLTYLNTLLHPHSNPVVLDRGSYVIENGSYKISYRYQNRQREIIYISLTDDYLEIYLYVYMSDMFGGACITHRQNKVKLEKFIEEVHNRSMNPVNYLIQFILKDDGQWSNPIVSEHRAIRNLTPEMLLVKTHIDHFLSDATKQDYKGRGIAYRYGLMLCGNSGTGKSTIAELVAKEHLMDMYCINLISHNMNDIVLQQSCVTVEKGSLIVIDEFDKMYEKILLNKKTKVTMSGVLSALDGVIRLPDGCIVIVIMNGKLNDVITNVVHRNALVRPGRLDQCVDFVTPYVI